MGELGGGRYSQQSLDLLLGEEEEQGAFTKEWEDRFNRLANKNYASGSGRKNLLKRIFYGTVT